MTICLPMKAAEDPGMTTPDICKMILGPCPSEKHSAPRGGGINYCTGPHDCASTKDNYCKSRVGNNFGRSDSVAPEVCKYHFDATAETEAESTEESKSVSFVLLERATSDNTLFETTCEVAVTVKGKIPSEVLGGTMTKNSCEAVEIGADVTLPGRSMYLAKLTDSLPERSA